VETLAEVKWSMEQVMEARRLASEEGATVRALSNQFGVSRRLIKKWLESSVADIKKLFDSQNTEALPEPEDKPKNRRPGRPRKDGREFSLVELAEDLQDMSQLKFTNRVDFQLACQQYSSEALSYIIGLLRSERVPPKVRLEAASYLIDQGWGKSTQPLALSGEVSQRYVSETTRRIISNPELRESARHLFRRTAHGSLGGRR